uniref:Secreted protein n=1 Tax=Setaria viridis TaxID=4556 RepID=A0A4V6D7F8_SETVI|nr:hypothetical protein SEVIR_5G395550v2 [Setaria viridis]
MYLRSWVVSICLFGHSSGCIIRVSVHGSQDHIVLSDVFVQITGSCSLCIPLMITQDRQFVVLYRRSVMCLRCDRGGRVQH